MDTDVKEVLKAIKATNSIKERVHKELGLSKITEAPEDMYKFVYQLPDMDSRHYTIFHGKCSESGKSRLASIGYTFTVIQHFAKDDITWCRVKCTQCGELLDEKTAKKLNAEKADFRKQLVSDYEEEKLIREEWEAEQILLGKM